MEKSKNTPMFTRARTPIAIKIATCSWMRLNNTFITSTIDLRDHIRIRRYAADAFIKCENTSPSLREINFIDNPNDTPIDSPNIAAAHSTELKAEN